MTSSLQSTRRLWNRCLVAVDKEYRALDPQEKDWILRRLGRIAAAQRELNDLFVAAEGPHACRQCSGACCDSGRNHFSLASLLAFVSAGLQPPDPDFSRPCPFLGEQGCLIEASRRPFNCVTFVCEPVLESLGREAGERYLRLEKELHAHYLAFDRRYAGSSPCGLLIRADRMAGRPLLARIDQEPTDLV